MSTDPFEEFEFRPLTEGLGFHRQSDKKSTAQPEVIENPPQIEMPLAARNSLERSQPEIKRKPLTPELDSTSSVDEILKTLQQKRKLSFNEEKKQTEQNYQATTLDPSAAVLDGMLITAGGLACLIILLMVTKVDLFGTLSQAHDAGVYIGLFAIFAGVAWIYLTMNRVFLGFTPGEWVFDQRIGTPEQLGSANLSLKVAARSTLIVATGLLPLPLLSLALRRDLAGQISGAHLLKKV